MITTYYGKNRYLALKEIKQRIKNATDFNVNDLEEPTLQELSEAVNTSPLMGTRRFIIVHSLKKLGTEKRLISVLENKRETSHVLFIIPEYGKQWEKLRVYLRKFQVIKVDLFDDKKAKTYAKNTGGSMGIDFGQDDTLVDYFIFLVGTSPEVIDIELEALKNARPLNMQTVGQHINRRTDQNLYSLVERIYVGQMEGLLSQIETFINENPTTNIPSLLNFLIADLKAGLMVKDCVDKKMSVHQIPLSSYRIKYLRKKVGPYSEESLITFFCSLNEAVYYTLRMGENPIPKLYASIHNLRKEKII